MKELVKYKVRVYHDTYGCDTGCCGHIVEITSTDSISKTEFHFTHPHGERDMKIWAKELAMDTIKANWPECLDSINWDSLDYSEVNED